MSPSDDIADWWFCMMISPFWGNCLLISPFWWNRLMISPDDIDDWWFCHSDDLSPDDSAILMTSPDDSAILMISPTDDFAILMISPWWRYCPLTISLSCSLYWLSGEYLIHSNKQITHLLMITPITYTVIYWLIKPSTICQNRTISLHMDPLYNDAY